MGKELISLEDMQRIFGWHGHSAYFNTQLSAFPLPVVEENGIKLYDIEEVKIWEHDRPLGNMLSSDQIWLTTLKNQEI